MGKFKELTLLLLSKIIEHKGQSIAGLLTIGTVAAKWNFLAQKLEGLVSQAHPSTLMVVCILLISLIWLTAVVCIKAHSLQNKLKENFKPKFNVKWDSEFNPHCPKCLHLLTNPPNPNANPFITLPPMLQTKMSLKCHTCGVDYPLVDINNRMITVAEAVAQLKSKV